MRFHCLEKVEEHDPGTSQKQRNFISAIRASSKSPSGSRIACKEAIVEWKTISAQSCNFLEEERSRIQELAIEHKQAIQSVCKSFEKANIEMNKIVEQSLKKVKDINDQLEKERREKELEAEKERKEKQMQEETAKNTQKELEAKKKQQELEALKKQQEKEAEDKRKEQMRQEEVVASVPQKTMSDTPSIKKEYDGSEEAWKLRCKYLEQKLKFKALKNDKNFAISNEMYKSKMLITTKIGQLTRNQTRLIKAATEIRDELDKARKQSEQYYFFLLNILAKQIVKQAETEVAVKLNMAFPLALVADAVVVKHAMFYDVLMGTLVYRCPYISPVYLFKQQNEGMDEYKKKLGYREDESEIQYGERMCGILSFYFALSQHDFSKDIPFTVQDAWIWLSRLLNMQPIKITPLLLITFLEIGGNALLKAYKKQAAKLIYLVNGILMEMPAESIASTTRLKLFMDENFNKNQMIPPYPNSFMEK